MTLPEEFSELDPQIAERLLRQWDGEAGAEDRQVVDQWIAADPKREQLVALLFEAWQQPAEKPSSQATETTAAIATFERRVLDAIREDLLHEEPVPHRVSAKQKQSRLPGSRSPLRHVLAGAALAGCAGLVMYWAQGRSESPDAPAKYATAMAEQKTITLGDGAEVTLAPQTTLAVYADLVVLDGQAMFHVRHQSNRPFVVTTRRSSVRVLGTTFSVRDYGDDDIARVAVREGKVSVGSPGNAVRLAILAAGDAIGVTSDGVADSIPVSAASILGWTNGTLTFDKTPLRNVAAELTRWYGVPFMVQDTTVAQVPLTMTFKRSDSIHSIMHAISVTTGLAVQQDSTSSNVSVVISAAPRAVVVPALEPTPAVARGPGQ